MRKFLLVINEKKYIGPFDTLQKAVDYYISMFPGTNVKISSGNDYIATPFSVVEIIIPR